MNITEDYQNLKDFFWEVNRAFMEKSYVLLDEEVSKRCLCGALMHELNKQLEKNDCNNYYVFNRNKKELSSYLMTMALLIISCRIL